MLLCQQHGHEVVALANLLPADAGVDELDSYMFQTVGHHIIGLYAHCMRVPLLRRSIKGAPVQQVRQAPEACCLLRACVSACPCPKLCMRSNMRVHFQLSQLSQWERPNVATLLASGAGLHACRRR